MKSFTQPGPNPFTARLDMKTLEKLDSAVSIDRVNMYIA